MVTNRHLFLLIWLGTLALILIALYMQYVMNLVPCALCMTQRVFVIAVGVVAFIGWIHNPKTLGQKSYAVVAAILAIIGAAFSSRHLWLQSLPEDLVPSCGPSLAYLLETVPFMETIHVLIRGDGNCAESVWSLFGITIPGWTLVAFITLFLTNGVIFYKAMRS